jgi:hypothetical protein
MADATGRSRTPESTHPANPPHHETPRAPKRSERAPHTTVDPKRRALLEDIGPVPEIPVETFLAVYLPNISKFEKRANADSAMGINHEERSKQLVDDIRRTLKKRRHIRNDQWRRMQRLPSQAGGSEREIFNGPVQNIGNAVIKAACDLLGCPKRLVVRCDGSRPLYSERTDECRPDGVIHLAGKHVKHKAATPPGQAPMPHREDVAVVLEFKVNSNFVSARLPFSLDYANEPMRLAGFAEGCEYGMTFGSDCD